VNHKEIPRAENFFEFRSRYPFIVGLDAARIDILSIYLCESVVNEHGFDATLSLIK